MQTGSSDKDTHTAAEQEAKPSASLLQLCKSKDQEPDCSCTAGAGLLKGCASCSAAVSELPVCFWRLRCFGTLSRPVVSLCNKLATHLSVRLQAVLQQVVQLECSCCYWLQFGHLFARGETREAAIRAMVRALKQVKIRGEIRTIVDYTTEMIQHEAFVGNQHHTGWLDSRIAAHVSVTIRN